MIPGSSKAPTTEVEAAGVVGWVEDIAQKVSQYDVTYESLKSVATMCVLRGKMHAMSWREDASSKVFFSVEFIAGLQGLGLGVFFITGFGIFSVYSQHRKKQLCFCLLRSLEVLTLGGLVALAAKFAMDLDNMTADTMSQATIPSRFAGGNRK
eukprot:Skav227601  [mRNA]  locus=scaffold1141:297870:300690:+ [translate_table: standard]